MPTITLPLPDGTTSGHAKGHWRSAAAKTKAMREYAWGECFQIKGHPSKPYAKAIIHFAFFLASNRRRDTLNLMHGCKTYIDGIVDAGIIADDDWKTLSVGKATVSVDRDNPRVEITIVEATR